LLARVQIITHARPDDVPADYTSNTVYFVTAGTPVTADFQNLADAVSTMWKRDGQLDSTWGPFPQRSHEVRVYSMADPSPRPIRGHKTYTAQFPEVGDLAARQLAIVLSYYSDRNLPRQRGRIYIGPMSFGNFNPKERLSPNTMAIILDLGRKLQAVGVGLTPSWAHAVHSSREPTVERAVNHYWVDDVWDSQRRRDPKPSTRVHYDV
jgi:hypothetical protein